MSVGIYAGTAILAETVENSFGTKGVVANFVAVRWREHFQGIEFCEHSKVPSLMANGAVAFAELPR